MQHVDMLEIDVHFSKDNHLVVIHDDTINRTSNGEGKVKDYTLEELLKFDFGVKHDKSFQNTKISTFEEVLSLIKIFQKLLIEIKVPHQYPGIEEAVLNALEIYKVPKYKAIIQSFDEDCVKRLNSMDSEYQGCLLVERNIGINLQILKKYLIMQILLILITN